MRRRGSDIHRDRDQLHVVHVPVERARGALLVGQVLAQVRAELVVPVRRTTVMGMCAGERFAVLVTHIAR